MSNVLCVSAAKKTAQIVSEGPPSEDEIAERRRRLKSARKRAYQREADPLFFKWQAGEATQEEWEAARQSIRDRYPYPGE